MTEKEWLQQLKDEGFTDLNVFPNPPGTDFSDHIHKTHTVHVILEGEFTTVDKFGKKVYKAGDRFEIPAGTKHSAKCGPNGCTFIVGTKEAEPPEVEVEIEEQEKEEKGSEQVQPKTPQISSLVKNISFTLSGITIGIAIGAAAAPQDVVPLCPVPEVIEQAPVVTEPVEQTQTPTRADAQSSPINSSAGQIRPR